jgi:probable F420-dependent oxidoreductase
MKLGVALPHIGPTASPEAIIETAAAAEGLGFDSVWVLDRLLWPLEPTARYPGNPRGELPAVMQIVYEPLTVLSFIAARTTRLELGTSVIVAAYRSPILAAKIGATLDRLSGGRLILGVGAGWSADEFVAVDQPITERDRRTDEFIRALRSLWSAGETRFDGDYYRVPPSICLPKPLQPGGPPIWIGGNSNRALRRAAELGDGWHPTGRMKPEAFAEKVKLLRRLTVGAGRDARAVALTLRWNAVSDLEEQSDIDAFSRALSEYRSIGVQHICFDLNIPRERPLARMLATMERIKKISSVV